jgi:HSP20 family protein
MAKEERRHEGERSLAARQYHDPFSLVDAMFERMHRDFFPGPLMSLFARGRGDSEESGGMRVPRVQMRGTGDTLEISAELPGVDPKDVKVECEADVLTISGESRAEEEREGGHLERYSSFYRQIPLPEGVEAEQAQASYRNGMLTIRFPRRAPRDSARQIPVSTESEQGGTQSTKGKAA